MDDGRGGYLYQWVGNTAAVSNHRKCIVDDGILNRMVPAVALTKAIPDLPDRGAFMNINSSLQQIAGGIAAAAAGMIVTQKN